MNRKITFLLSTIILLSSCAGKFSLIKRKYTKGYYVSSSKKPANTKKEIETKSAVAKVRTPTIAPVNIETLDRIQDGRIPKTVIVKDVKVVELAHKSLNPKNAGKLTASAAKLPGNNPENKIISFRPLALNSNLITNKSADDSGGNLLILVILCFLWWLNLIAVYIKDGRKFTLNFLITFLLDFTLIGGVIYSLLVVLDVVDLA